jgi:ADP-heptose:LPS heptosyltransferase
MEKLVWVVNKGENEINEINMKLRKQVTIKPSTPIQLPLQVGLSYVKRYFDIEFCENPEEYFTKKHLQWLIIRDAGIGDLLLLEPIIRKLTEKENIDVTLASMFPEVYDNNPCVTENKLITAKYNIKEIKLAEYDCWEDLRSYSETAQNRHEAHRTDVYNNKFNLEMTNEEKQPCLYFKRDEKSKFKKKDGYKYIGIQLDASHKHRRYDRGNELIEYVLKQDKKNIVVIFGSYNFVKGYNKDKRIIDLQGKTTVREAILIVRDMDYMISSDSGLMHIGLALHVPTVCLFGIITPELRVKYYKGHRRVIWKDLQCKGCGDFHMEVCKHEDKDKRLVPCMNIDPSDIYSKMMEMPLNPETREFYQSNGHKEIKKDIQIIAKPIAAKLTMPIIVQNEEDNLPRFIDLVMSHPSIGRVIAIDGGSTDRTVEMLEKAGAFVYVHPYDRNYHDMQAVQRNYSCSFVKDGEKIIIMDLDECFSKELSDYLPVLAESGYCHVELSRRTYEYYEDIIDPTKQILHYPDWQPRFFTWKRNYKWVGSPHHKIYNVVADAKIQKDILHFQCEGKNRKDLERRWAEMDVKTKEVYG